MKVPLRKAPPRILTAEEASQRGLLEGGGGGGGEATGDEEGSETTEPFDVMRNVDKSNIQWVEGKCGGKEQHPVRAGSVGKV